jgi:two-component system sensor histidine kinase SenX3
MLHVICGALVILLGALTAMQQQWSVRVAAADVQREKEHLDSSASLFASQFNELAFQATQFLRQDAWAAVQRGEKLTSTPKLIGELYYLEVPEQGRERLQRLNATGFFRPVAQPDWLTNSHCAGLVIERPPAIVVHMYDTAAAQAPDGGSLDSRPPGAWQDRCFVAGIDRAYLRHSVPTASPPELRRDCHARVRFHRGHSGTPAGPPLWRAHAARPAKAFLLRPVHAPARPLVSGA